MLFKKYYQVKDKPVISFEIFPPKTDEGLKKLKDVTLPQLITLDPSYITVTYGAMGTTREKTLDIASFIKNELSMETACHLTCVGSTRDDIDKILDNISTSNIRNIVALRGDPPKDGIINESSYNYANELVAHIRDYEQKNNIEFSIAVAGYPEKHLEAQSMEIDIENLKKKINAGSDIIITQLFFLNQYYYDFVDITKSHGIDIPVIPGLMPILSTKQIQRISSMCGSKIPDYLKDDLDKAGSDDRKAKKIGIDQCIIQANDLLNTGVPGIHFYVLNHSEHITEIISQLDL
ncbi:MAG: methylenetetrahydrofolate reductase [NAD(P)H] [Candidatus Dadabacteria bacterium]|nr:methylenetetrahydrofolate reductase [NAD(P)H] [Candidatus Dadabacteria bacterium]